MVELGEDGESLTYLVWSLSHSERPKDGATIEATDHEHAAEEGAAYYHNECDCWEVSWPVQFAVQATEGEDRKVRVYDVERIFDPVFQATHNPRSIYDFAGNNQSKGQL